MDFKNIFISLAVVLLVVISTASYASFLSQKYVSVGGTAVDTSFYDDLYSPMRTNISGLSSDVAGSTESGGVSVDPTQSAVLSSRGTFNTLRMLIGFVPALFGSIGKYLQIPEIYTSIASWVFNFVFGLTLAYLIFLGVRRLIT